MRWTASNQYQKDKRMGSVVGQGEHDSQLLRMLEDTGENKSIMIPIYRWGEIQSVRTQSRLNSKKIPC